MPRPRRKPPTLAVRIVGVPDPHADETMDLVMELLADALADQAIAEARAEIAARQGVDADAIDRERSHLDAEDRRVLDSLAVRGLA